MMRKSLQDIKHMVQIKLYPKRLPDELIPYHAYLIDSGHSILCVLESMWAEAKSDPDMYEVAVPVKYVIEKGYRIEEGYVIVDAPYDKMVGLDIKGNYEEF